jgi:hypothetical protein
MAAIRRKYWMFRPLIALGRVLTAMGLMRDRAGAFEVTLAGYREAVLSQQVNRETDWTQQKQVACSRRSDFRWSDDIRCRWGGAVKDLWQCCPYDRGSFTCGIMLERPRSCGNEPDINPSRKYRDPREKFCEMNPHARDCCFDATYPPHP